MKNTPRTHHQVACDGVQTIWLPSTPSLRFEVEKTVSKSVDGIIFSSSVHDVAMHIHRNDTLRAMGGRSRVVHVQDTLTDFIATMDGVRSRRVVPLGA